LTKYLRFLGIIILLIILLKIDFDKLLRIIYQANILYLLIAIILNIPQVFLKSYRWNRLLCDQNVKYTKVQSFLVYLSSIYIGFVTPGRIGEFTKVLYLKSDKGVSLSKGMSSVLMDRLFDMYLLIIIGIVGIWHLDMMGRLTNAYFALIIIISLAPVLLLNKQLVRRFLGLLYYLVVIRKFKGKIEETFEDFYNGINQLINPKLVYSVFLTCLSYLIFFIQCYLLVIAIGISINFTNITFFMAISNLISFIPISISGLGTRDVTLIYLFSLVRLKPELAVSYAFLIFITIFVCGGLMGAIAWWIKPLEAKRSI
jgi:glycosyltransferase 2 family protein